MKCKIIAKATDMFLKLGFKSVTMDDIAKHLIKYKNYVLINTNFGLGNNVKSESDVINNYIIL